MRSIWKLALATFISVALVIGFAGTSATAAPVRAAAQQTQSAERANDCGQQQSRLAQTKRNAKIKKAQLTKAGKVLKQANKRLQKAKKSGQKAKQAKVKKAKKNVKRAKANKSVKVRKLKKARNMVAVAARQLRACQQADGGGAGSAGPLQPVCDAGLPQPICDALDGLPLPAGTPGATSPIQALCDAGLPQAICDAATSMPALPGGDNPLQALCDAGLPQGICDLATGQVGTDTLPIPGGLPGIPAFPGVESVPGLDTILLLLSPLTSQVPLGTLCATVDIPVVCDLVG